MNFFEHQDAARRSTRFLVLFYILTVLCIIAAVYFAVQGAFYLAQAEQATSAHRSPPPFQIWNPDVFWNVSLAVAALVLFGTIYKTLQLRQGGRIVAELLGGRLIHPDTSDPDEKRVLNVVEEMAIASGTSVPPVYLLNEKSINAFAAGFSTRDAVIGVTSGSVKLLSRDELQGVIAHEFSHILNGDMRLNIRLMGVLHGILLIALMGRTMVYMAGRGRRSRDRSTAFFLIAGFVLLIIGYAGVFFASLIKSAVSRQRESLADACAVQFTRHPAGLSGALKKIGGLEYGSLISHPKAEQASHFYFANGLHGNFFQDLLATHPPIHARIKKLDPAFDGRFPRVEYPKPEAPPVPKEGKAERFTQRVAVLAAALQPGELISQAGQVTSSNLAYAAALLQEIPPVLREAVRDPVGARAVIFSLLLDPSDPAVKKAQQYHLFLYGNYQVHRQVLKIASETERLDVRLRLPLVDLALPVLTTLSQQQYEMFRRNVGEIIAADGKIHYFEFAMKLVIFHHLEGFFGPDKDRAKPPAAFSVEAAGTELLAGLARAGHAQEEKAGKAFLEARRLWDESSNAEFGKLPWDAARAEQAVYVLEKAPFQTKEKFLKACVCVLLHDGQIMPEEIEMVRAFADALDCPLPPLSV